MGTAAAVAVVVWSVALCHFDIRELRLPNVLTIPGAIVILAGAALAGRGSAALAGALMLAAVYLAVHLIAPSGMGAGDVKLALALGALTGALGTGVWIISALAAPIFTAALGLTCRSRRRIPHGPSMLLASLAAAALALL